MASLGKRGDAETAALEADALGAEAATKEGARAVSVYTRWTRLALARGGGRGLRDAATAAATRSGRLRFQWIGFAEATMAWARPEAANEGAIAETLGAWSAAVALPPEGRRAVRYDAYAHRGDAPPAHVAYLSLAADLLGQSEGDVELWLDTFDAVDARRFTLRAYAWYRAEAARWRGDAENAATWSTRFHALGVLAADPARAEIAQYLGI